jgi:hypothetical protein
VVLLAGTAAMLFQGCSLIVKSYDVAILNVFGAVFP